MYYSFDRPFAQYENTFLPLFTESVEFSAVSAKRTETLVRGSRLLTMIYKKNSVNYIRSQWFHCNFAVKGEPTMMDAETMRRWSMPWESKSDRNTVTWHQTRIISKLAVPIVNPTQSTISKTSNDRSQTTTPGAYLRFHWIPYVQKLFEKVLIHCDFYFKDSVYQSSTTSQDGLAEAIHLLSCRPRMYQPALGQSLQEQPLPSTVCIALVGATLNRKLMHFVHFAECSYLWNVVKSRSRPIAVY